MSSPCPACNGCGQRVIVSVTHDSQGNEIVHHQAVPCPGCGGKGRV